MGGPKIPMRLGAPGLGLRAAGLGPESGRRQRHADLGAKRAHK